MASFITASILFFYVLFCLVPAGGSLRVTLERYKHELNLRGRQTGDVSAKQGPSLYWIGNWTVGASPNMRLLIDTGSSDLIVQKGRYQRYNRIPCNEDRNFTISYEGVNRAGFGFEQINGTVRCDLVSQGNLSVPNQAIGEVSSERFFDVHVPKSYNISHGHGIIGFRGRRSSYFNPPALSWFHHLCHDKAISECRFGFALGSSGVGEIVIGELDTELIDGPLTTVPMVGKEYQVQGDVFVDGEIVSVNQSILLDVGTDNIQGPPSPVLKIFKKLGFQTIIKKGKNFFNPAVPVENIFGYFPCNKPPSIGFGFPSKVDLKPGQSQRVFNISTSAGVWDVFGNGNNNCTSILGATNALTNSTTGATYWLLGQPFFQELYIDFNDDTGLFGFGKLVNPKKVT